jgi:hypothetical protein
MYCMWYVLYIGLDIWYVLHVEPPFLPSPPPFVRPWTMEPYNEPKPTLHTHQPSFLSSTPLSTPLLSLPLASSLHPSTLQGHGAIQ